MWLLTFCQLARYFVIVAAVQFVLCNCAPPALPRLPPTPPLRPPLSPPAPHRLASLLSLRVRRGSDLFRSESRIEKARAALRAEDAKDAESGIAVFATVKQERRAAGGGGASEAGKAHAAAEATTAEMVACVTPRPKAHPAPIARRASGKRR